MLDFIKRLVLFIVVVIVFIFILKIAAPLFAGGHIFVLLFGLCVYFLPAMLAQHRGHNNFIAILVTNFLAFLIFPWFIALIWALTCNVKNENN